MSEPEFKSFRKIPRLYRECIITEKIDGTNAQVVIPEIPYEAIKVGSRNRWITPGKKTDNYDFASFVYNNEEAIRKLGPGTHFGEWWGAGIARKYGLTERRWSLFNWTNRPLPDGLPSNITVVPVLYTGMFSTTIVTLELDKLVASGSIAAPGFMNPEGVVVNHLASGTLYKITTDGDGHKGVR